MDSADALLDLAVSHLRRLHALFGSRGIHVRARGTFATMLVTFCWKQEDHAGAILSLGRHRDVQLVARSMIEGLCQLKWAAQDASSRAELWRLFAWVHDWRLMQRMIRSGKRVPEAKRRQIEEGIKQHGPLFETKRSGGSKSRKRRSDPYVHHWSGKSIAQLCEEVQGRLLYEWPYSAFSDWHHWSPAGVIGALKAEGRKIRLPQPTARHLRKLPRQVDS